MRIAKIITLGVALAISIANANAQTPADSLRKLGVKLTEAKGVIVQAQANIESFTEADFRTLASCTTLKKLSVDGKTLTDATLPLLAELKDLEELSTNQSRLTDDGYRHFAAIANLKSLALFHPSWDMKEFTGSGLAHLKSLPKLERLTFAGSTAGDEAMAAIGALTNLREFRTWHTMQTQAGNEHLLKLTKLATLRIGQRLPRWGQSPPASFDAATIPTIAQLSSLERLEIMEARLTAANLLPLKELPRLKRVVIQQTDISAADVETLRSSLPNVQIDFTPISAAERESLIAKKLKL